MQHGERENSRKYILGASELFPETPVLVDYTQFDIFADVKQPTMGLSETSSNLKVDRQKAGTSI